MDRSCEKLRNMTKSPREEKVLHSVTRRNGNWIGHILRRKCFVKHFIERKRGEGYGDRKTRKKT